MIIAGILLAAGASRRFGKDDKLLALLNGAPLVSHAANALRAFNPDVLIGVTRSPDVAALLTGFECVRPPEDDPLQSDSLRAGVTRASELGATRLIIVLGDMPFVTAELLQDVVSRCTETTPSATGNGERVMPPACFPTAYIPQLLGIKGDRGAATLLQGLPASAITRIASSRLLDVDTVDQLKREEQRKPQ